MDGPKQEREKEIKKGERRSTRAAADVSQNAKNQREEDLKIDVQTEKWESQLVTSGAYEC